MKSLDQQQWVRSSGNAKNERKNEGMNELNELNREMKL